VRHIVTVADVGEAAALHISEALEQRQVVRQRLAGMLQVAERVDHRDTQACSAMPSMVFCE
jgi:hypothetical protein